MDDVKDPQRKAQPSRFLDNRTLRVQTFGSNVSAERAYRRAERLVAAVHLVTNHVPVQEPARIRARRYGLDLLSSFFVLRDEMRSPESGAFKKAQGLIRELVSHVRILSVSGHVSVQNAETLVEALDELANFLVVSQRSVFSESTPLAKDELLDVEYAPIPRVRLSDIKYQRGGRSVIKDKRKLKEGMSNRGDRMHARSDRIVGVLTTQGQLGIKDIAASLPEYSEKMIQRELKDLVTLGRVNKTGSKRWSIYALARS